MESPNYGNTLHYLKKPHWDRPKRLVGSKSVLGLVNVRGCNTVMNDGRDIGNRRLKTFAYGANSRQKRVVSENILNSPQNMKSHSYSCFDPKHFSKLPLNTPRKKGKKVTIGPPSDFIGSLDPYCENSQDGDGITKNIKYITIDQNNCSLVYNGAEVGEIELMAIKKGYPITEILKHNNILDKKSVFDKIEKNNLCSKCRTECKRTGSTHSASQGKKVSSSKHTSILDRFYKKAKNDKKSVDKKYTSKDVCGNSATSVAGSLISAINTEYYWKEESAYISSPKNCIFNNTNNSATTIHPATLRAIGGEVNNSVIFTEDNSKTYIDHTLFDYFSNYKYCEGVDDDAFSSKSIQYTVDGVKGTTDSLRLLNVRDNIKTERVGKRPQIQM
ncbi:hypothetical protein AX774_g157 [Zancudomyces culisetae]|uniref:Uncharacterized protein n=1 Tax=Zancudomyces culisetae TaxID=1213189 RepID=A0A1R1PZ95_ZANCU|nr:hypothetical protein AX774_g157 [Zancudomyces culisetae]|eukprot:OMH86266.1 hypothetical protein AX774_g157 [Zancudomyces culisetae]